MHLINNPDPYTDFPKWCHAHGACEDGQAFANQHPTLELFWAACRRPDWMLWVDARANILTDKQRRLFAVWCARSCNPTDMISIAAINCAERHAHGQATDGDLAAARDAARDTAWDAARAAAGDAAGDAAWDAAWAAAGAAAGDAARAAAGDAARAAARDTAWAAARAAARNAQAHQLRKITDASHQ